MQNLPSKNTIIRHCTTIKNYCTPYNLTYCDPEEDYKILKKNKISDYLILNCLQAVIFVIETKVIYPRYVKELLLLKEEDKKFDPSFIIENTNILDFNEYCQRSKSPNIDTKRCEYYKHYESLMKAYEQKAAFVRKNIKDGIDWVESKKRIQKKPEVDFEKLNNYEKAFFIFMSIITPNALRYINICDIIDVVYINPNIDIHTIKVKNYIDLINKKLVINVFVLPIKDEIIESLKVYITEYNIQHEQKLFNLSRSLFSKIFPTIFNCSFLDYKKYNS